MSTILSFFDPTEEYGGFSNIAPIACHVRGHDFPTVQKAVYSFLLGDFPDKDRVLLATNQYDMVQNFKYAQAQKYLHDLYIATTRAYTARLKTDPVAINATERYIFYRPNLLLEQRCKYVLGQDTHNYGYNIVGCVLQEIYHKHKHEDARFQLSVHMAYRACVLVLSLIREGGNVGSLRGLLPIEILQFFGENTDEYTLKTVQETYAQYQDRTLAHLYFVQQEMLYPRSLVFFVLKQEAPFINFYIHARIQDKLLYQTCAHLLAHKYEVVSKFIPTVVFEQLDRLSPEQLKHYKDRLMTLYGTKRLPVKASVQEDIHRLVLNRISDAEVEAAVNFIPMNPPAPPGTALCVSDEPNEPLSPTVTCSFVLDGFQFFTVLHAIMYHLFSTILDKTDAYSLLFKRKEIPAQPTLADFVPARYTDFDDMYQRLLQNYTVTILREAMMSKFQRNPWLQQLLYRTEKQGITGFVYNDPSDPLIGYDPSLAAMYDFSMNQTGKILLEIRSIINPELQQEYSFFWERVGNDTRLHAWLKERMMDLRRSLTWFKKIMPLNMKNVRLFFSKLYTPYHVIYRADAKSAEDTDAPEPFFIQFFQGLELPDNVRKYVFDHFNFMFNNILQLYDHDLGKLAAAIQQTHDTTTKLTSDDARTIVKRLVVVLQYLPRKYSPATLSALLCILQGSDVPLPIPESTFIMFDTKPTYLYVSPAILSILESTAGMTPATIGDIGYTATYLLNHVSIQRYRFFFT